MQILTAHNTAVIIIIIVTFKIILITKNLNFGWSESLFFQKINERYSDKNLFF